MARPARVVSVEYLGEFRLRLRFSDDLVRELDFAGTLTGGVFTPLEDAATFAQASVDHESGTVVWPGGIDIDPDVLHGDHEPAAGQSARVLKEYRASMTG